MKEIVCNLIDCYWNIPIKGKEFGCCDLNSIDINHKGKCKDEMIDDKMITEGRNERLKHKKGGI